MSEPSRLSNPIRHVAERLAGEVTTYYVLSTRLNRDNARQYIAKLRDLLNEVEQGIDEREKQIGRAGE